MVINKQRIFLDTKNITWIKDDFSRCGYLVSWFSRSSLWLATLCPPSELLGKRLVLSIDELVVLSFPLLQQAPKCHKMALETRSLGFIFTQCLHLHVCTGPSIPIPYIGTYTMYIQGFLGPSLLL